MLRDQVLTALYSKRKTFAEFNWDALFAPSIYCFISEYDIQKLYNIGTSIKYAGDITKKEKAIRNIMEPLGFRRLASGTNRIVYTYLEDTTFLVKVAVDKTGMKNTPDEFRNQMFLKPFVAKCFESHPTGIIGSFERGMPITNIEEFVSIWDDVFEAILSLIGEWIIEDIGTKFFMNWMIRDGFGPVLCDYPEVFKLDGNKLFCSKPAIMGQKLPLCGGLIDYDEGFNYLVCTKCGKQYTARELSKAVENKLIVMKGDIDMDVQLVRGNEVIVDGRDYGTATIRPPKMRRSREIQAAIGRQDDIQQMQENMEVTNRILEIAMQNGDTSAAGMMNAIKQVSQERLANKCVHSTTGPAYTTHPTIELEDFTDKESGNPTTVIPPAEEASSEQDRVYKDPIAVIKPAHSNDSSAEVEESTDLPESEQSGNRVKPVPPSMEQY